MGRLSVHRSLHRCFLQDHRIKKHKVTTTDDAQSDTIKQSSRHDGNKKHASKESAATHGSKPEKHKSTSHHVKKNGLSGQGQSSGKGQGQTGTSSVS